MEIPGDVLLELRTFKGDTRYSFSKRLARSGIETWLENIVKNLEIGKTKFTYEHLAELLKSGIIASGDQWHWRFPTPLPMRQV